MSEQREQLEPLDPDLALLVGAERARPAMPAETRARLRARIEAASGPSAAVRSPGWRRSIADGLRRRPLSVAVVAFVAGGIAGAILHALLSGRPGDGRGIPSAAPAPAAASQQPSSSSAAASSSSSSSSAAAAPAAAPAPPVPVPDRAPAAAPAPARPRPERPTAGARKSGDAVSAAPTGRDGELAAERALIEVARTAIARGEGAAALDALQEHSRRYPGGRLAEEREALMVQALVRTGRGADARARAERFRQRFPGSLLLPVVDDAVRSIP